MAFLLRGKVKTVLFSTTPLIKKEKNLSVTFGHFLTLLGKPEFFDFLNFQLCIERFFDSYSAQQ